MFLLIYNLDGDINDKPLCILKQGEYNIGRGELLQCTDKRASRAHATIKITTENATITAIHQNPCFFQASNSKTVTILTKDVPAELRDGDKFGIFADQYWFNVKFSEHVNNIENLEINETTSQKRALVEDIDLQQNKIIKLDENVNDMLASQNEEQCKSNLKIANDKESIHQLLPNNNDEHEVIKLNSVTNDMELLTQHTNSELQSTTDISSTDTNVGDMTDQTDTAEFETPNSNTELESTTDIQHTDTVDVEKPTSSGDNASASTNNHNHVEVQRDRCLFGRKCYRKNLEHKKEFSHPGDSDYESDPNDNRPICKYGMNCYRRNKDHRKEYRHPRRNSRKKRTQPPSEQFSDDEDDDPFLTDGTEDEYSQGSWSDSDDSCSNSQIPFDIDDDDGDENTKTLIKEAKRFTKN